MDSTSATARDLTDPAQNQAVLDVAACLLEDGDVALIEDGDRARRGGGDNPAVLAEARAAARGRQRLGELTEPVHLSVVWAMYGETGRIVPRSEHPHGEDFLRMKVRQLDWLTDGLPGVTWSILACDDGCPDQPPSAEVMADIVRREGYPTAGHRGVDVLRLADVITGVTTLEADLTSPALLRLASTDQSRKGGSILAGLTAALTTSPTAADGTGRHVLCYTDADLSANLAQLGSLAARVVCGEESHDRAAAEGAVRERVVAALGQRYGMDGAVLVKAGGPSVEPHSTGDKPDKLIVLFRHFVRAILIPDLAHVLDTQAGFKAFDAAALRPVLPQTASFNETFDVELLVHLAQLNGAHALAVEPIVFTEDFAATNFPSVDPGPRHLAMVHQVVDLYDRLVAPIAPVTGDAAELLDLVRGLDLDGYVAVIEQLRAEDPGDETLFDRRWPVQHVRGIVHR